MIGGPRDSTLKGPMKPLRIRSVFGWNPDSVQWSTGGRCLEGGRSGDCSEQSRLLADRQVIFGSRLSPNQSVPHRLVSHGFSNAIAVPVTNDRDRCGTVLGD